MQCFVYKSESRENHYLYLGEEVDDITKLDIPDALLTMMGELAFVVEFDLHPRRVMPGADAQQVITDIEQQGYFLQLPKEDQWVEEERLFK